MSITLVLAAALAAQPAPKEVPLVPPELDRLVEAATRPDDRDTPLRKLQKERVRERAAYVKYTAEVIAIGQWDVSFFEGFVKTQAALAENLAELVEKPEDRVKCHEVRVAALKGFESFIAALVKAGRNRPQDLNLARAARIDAEIDLLKLKASDAKPPAGGGPEVVSIPESPNCVGVVTMPARPSRGPFPLRHRH